MLNDIQKYSPIEPSPITYADLIKQSYQIHITSIQCSKKANGHTKWGTKSKTIESTSTYIWLVLEPDCHVSRTNKQKVVSSENHKAMWGTQCYIITMEEGMRYRKMQMHLKPYWPRHQTNNKQSQTTIPYNDIQIQLRPRNNIKPPTRLQIVKK